MSIRRFGSLIFRLSACWQLMLSAVALLGVFAATPVFAQAELSGEKAKLAERLRADLSRLAEAQKGYFAKNKRFANDMSALAFAPTSGGSVTISYASARMWQANALHSSITPFVCFVIVNTPEGNSPVEKPFCTDANRTPGASALANAGPAASTRTAAPPVEQKKAAVSPPVKTQAPPPQANVRAAARAATHPAGPVANAGTVESVTLKAFIDRLDQIASGAAEVMRSKPPEFARDPYESSAEYAARRAEYDARSADAMAAYNRREADYYAKNTRTFVVDLPAKDAKYDSDRELLEVTIDPVALPTMRSLTAGGRPAALAVNCYTRPVFLCSPDEGMTYEPGELWRVTRAKAREVDVLKTPLTVQARFAVGPHDGSRGPALTLIGLELQAKGVTVARWSGSGAAGR